MNLNFTQYLLDFYGPKGIYDYNFSATEINLATQLYKTRLADYGQVEFEGDSIDRERVRDIVLHYRGETNLEHPIPQHEVA